MSCGARRSLGWIPFKARSIRYSHGQVYFQGSWLSLWDSFGLAAYELRAGCFAEDTRGRWYLNATVPAPRSVGGSAPSPTDQALGIDKCDDAGVWFEEIDEAFSTQTCSACHSRTGPRGWEGLGIREWTCLVCGTTHDRDRNSARNILAAGRRRLAEGIPALAAQAAA